MRADLRFFLFAIQFAAVTFASAQRLCDWMSETLDPSSTLKEITLPGAHDASVYRCFDCTIGANIKNTQTQYLPIDALLDSGIRYFDLRPVLDEGYFYTGHYTQYKKRPSFGCKGDSLERILKCIRVFLEQHAELVILHFSHYCNRGWKEDSAYAEKLFTLLEKNLGERIYTSDTTKKRIADMPLNQFIQNGKGKAILIFNDDYNGNKISLHKRGFFSVSRDIVLFDRYSNTTDVKFMCADQKQKFSKWKEKNIAEREELFVMPWTLTHNTKAAIKCSGVKWPWQKKVSIIDYARQAKKLMHPLITEWQQVGLITSLLKPNIINVDIADGQITRLCIQLNSKLKNNEHK
jgi:hypothetical protein